MGLFDFLKRNKTSAQAYDVIASIPVPFLYGIKEYGRQAAIQSCTQGQDLIIKAAPTSEHPLAFGVFTTKGKQLGELPPSVVKSLMTEYAGRDLSAAVVSVKAPTKTSAANIALSVIVYNSPIRWKGCTASEWDAKMRAASPVYVVNGGRVYHTDQFCCCDKDYKTMPLSKAEAAGLTPCKKCSKLK